MTLDDAAEIIHRYGRVCSSAAAVLGSRPRDGQLESTRRRMQEQIILSVPDIDSAKEIALKTVDDACRLVAQHHSYPLQENV